MKVEIFYAKNKFTRDSMMGLDWLKEYNRVPTRLNLEDTHSKVLEFDVLASDFNLEQIFMDLNFNPDKIDTTNFSAEPEGVWHQSMSVGDVVLAGRKMYIVDRIGFEEIV